MQIFVYEYTCASLCGSSLPASLRREGHAMLSAVLDDFKKIDGVETTTLLAADFPVTLSDEGHRRRGDERTQFQALASLADFTLVIAPEFDELLLTRCRWVDEAGGRSLNPDEFAISLTADKWNLAQHFMDHDVSTPRTELLASADLTQEVFPAICKPRFGAGSLATLVVNNEAEARQWKTIAGRQGYEQDGVIQPYLTGQPASVAFLIHDAARWPLWPCAQHISNDGQCRYLGGTVPLDRSLWHRAVTLAGSAVSRIDGLCGYAGVDLILGEATDGRDDVVIEVNPRLTTSYIGLRAISEINLAQLMLKLADERYGENLASPVDLNIHHQRHVRFYPDGKVEVRGAGL